MAVSTFNAGVTAILLNQTGRENGPDYMLKFNPVAILDLNTPANPNVAGAIDAGSSITEVLNVMSYLCSGTRTGAALIDTDNNNSVAGNVGSHTNDGFYAAGVAAIGDTFLHTSAAGANITPQLYDLNTLQLAIQAWVPANDNFIPVGILRRTGVAGQIGGPTLNVKVIPVGANIAPHITNNADIIALMSDCIKQMIHILENTRTIFGPKGWTALFNQVKGGGGKNHAKRTHRQHRRKYSSKHY
jgi:hypothetical protein